MRRRRFLQIACASALARPAQASTWRGVALGAQVEITLLGAQTGLLDEVMGGLREIEAAFSLYDPNSEISHANRGAVIAPSPLFADLVQRAGQAHRATGGLFDPTVQSLYAARAAGQAPPDAAIGWRWPLASGQQITFNGIAQGFAADHIRAALAARGVVEALVNIGEFAALGGPWHLELQDPNLALPVTLTSRARATSTAAPHLFHPAGGAARWSTVSVEADEAVWADALSTALIFATQSEIAAILRAAPGRPEALVIDRAGDARRIKRA